MSTAVAAVAVAVIGWIDYTTGPDIGLSLLYLIPIAVSAWYGGIGPAVLVASAAGASWLFADLAWRESDTAVAISVWNAFTRLVIYVSEGVFLALLHKDREKLRRLAARESALARTDQVTKLPNARAFLERVDAEIDRVQETGGAVCVVYIDLDNFKAFNDRLGHAAGDAILEEVARILTQSIGPGDVAARLGGDEFAVLLRDADAVQAQRVAGAIADSIRALGSAYADLGFGATVGVAHVRDVPHTAAELVRAADDAMYVGKAGGKGQVVVQNL